MSYNHVGDFKNLSKAGKNAVWNTLGTLPNLLPDSSKSTSSTTESAVSNGTIEVRDADFNIQTLSRDTKDSLNKLDEIFDKKKIEERQELSKLFVKEAFGQLHNWNPTSKEGKTAKAIAHGVTLSYIQEAENPSFEKMQMEVMRWLELKVKCMMMICF